MYIMSALKKNIYIKIYIKKKEKKKGTNENLIKSRKFKDNIWNVAITVLMY